MEIRQRGAPRYSYGLVKTGIAHADQFDNVREEHHQIIMEHFNTAREIRMAEQKKEAAEAKGLWDTA